MKFYEIRQYSCFHNFVKMYRYRFSSLLYSRKFFKDDIEVIICIKCKKIKL